MIANDRGCSRCAFRIVLLLAALSVARLIGVSPGRALADDTPLAGTKPVGTPEFYKVQIVPPAKVGDRFHMHREIDRSATESTEANNVPKGSNSLSAQLTFSGTLEVLAVDKQHAPTKWKVSAGTASLRQAGTLGHESLLKPGTEFTLTFAGGKATVADAEATHPLSDDAKKYLPYIFEATGGKGDTSLGDMLDAGSVSRGTPWSINTKVAAEALHGFDATLKATEVSGTARIKSDVVDGAKKTLLVDYDFKAEGKKPANPPNGMTPVSGSLSETGTISLPADGSTGYFSAKAVIHTTGTFKKTETKKESVFNGIKTVTKSVKVTEQTVIDQTEKVNTLITYESSGPGDKNESPSVSPTKPSPSASTSASSSQ